MKKIFIEGKEENLPKESGKYFVQYKNGNKNYTHFNLEKGFGNESLHMKAKVDWRLDETEKEQPTDSKTFEIDFGGHCKCEIEIINNIPKVIYAIDGWGDKIPNDAIKAALVNEIPHKK